MKESKVQTILECPSHPHSGAPRIHTRVPLASTLSLFLSSIIELAIPDRHIILRPVLSSLSVHFEVHASLADCPASLADCPASLADCLASLADCTARRPSLIAFSEMRRTFSTNKSNLSDYFSRRRRSLRNY